MNKRKRKFKLSEEQRKAIPEMLKRRSTRQLAYWLGVSQKTIWRLSQVDRKA